MKVVCMDDDVGKDNFIGDVLCTPMDLLERTELTLRG